MIGATAAGEAGLAIGVGMYMIGTYAWAGEKCPALPCIRKGRSAISTINSGREASGFMKRRASRRRDFAAPAPAHEIGKWQIPRRLHIYICPCARVRMRMLY